MKRFFLEIVVFICGAVVMAFEIIGSRMLGPFVGTSHFVWSSIIGVILISLSLGYYYGGKLADKKPSFSLLSLIILIAAVFIIISTLIKTSLLQIMLDAIDSVQVVAILSSLILFSIPGVLLGMVSPFAVKLKSRNLKTTGQTVGNLYALSTIGSIAGTFLAGFWLVPLFRISMILYLLAFTLIIFSVLLYLIYRNTIIQSHEEY